MSRPRRIAPRDGGIDRAVRVSVTEEHRIGLARQVAAGIAERIGLRTVHAVSVVTCVSELASNLYFHTERGGTITLRPRYAADAIGLEVIAWDEGPGIEDLALAMRDGFSTNGGLGGGLPGTRRLMDEFSILSQVGVGTWVRAVKWQSCE